MEDSVLREGSLDDAVDGVGDELGLEVEIGVGASVEPPAGRTAGVSRCEVDDVESEALCDTPPSDADERMTLVVLEHASSTPSPGATP